MAVLSPVSEMTAPDAPMVVAHIIAGVLTVAFLRRGEQLLRTVARWVRAALHRRMPPLQGVWTRRATALSDTARLIVTETRTGGVSRRGPPAFSCD
jgi:hypothetical protein